MFALFAACSGPTEPVTPSPSPTPAYPNILGNWRVVLTTVSGAPDPGFGGSRTCSGPMILRSQTGGAFSGNYQALVPCDTIGVVNGVMDVSGNISQFVFTQTLGGETCQYVSGQQNFAGTLSGNTLTLERKQTAVCAGVLGDRVQELTGTR